MFSEFDWLVKQEQLKDLRKQREMERLLPRPERKRRQARRAPVLLRKRVSRGWLAGVFRLFASRAGAG